MRESVANLPLGDVRLPNTVFCFISQPLRIVNVDFQFMKSGAHIAVPLLHKKFVYGYQSFL